MNFEIQSLTNKQELSLRTNLGKLDRLPHIKVIYGKKSTFSIKSTRRGLEGFTENDMCEIIYIIGKIQRCGIKLSSKDTTITED